MKRVFAIFVFIIIMISYHNIIFASYNNEEIEIQIMEETQRIFEERTRIWNCFLTGHYSSTEPIEEDLRLIIGNPLLKEDLDTFSQMLNNPSSYEKINDILVKDINLIKVNSKILIFEATILWELQYYEEQYKEEIKYKIQLDQFGNKWMLVAYDLV